MEPSYREHVSGIESDIGRHGFTTLHIGFFVDGSEALRKYEDDWADPAKQPRILNRTPLMIERDRIVYDDAFRRMTDRHHVLFRGQYRIFRNYMTQTLRSAQVARAVCSALQLNADFAEALALGSKVGALPFVHVSKLASCEWAVSQLRALDERAARRGSSPQGNAAPAPLLDKKGAALPEWLLGVGDEALRARAASAIPHSIGDQDERLYSSGKESCWMLSVDPFLQKPLKRTPFLPQTLYGIWRHSRGQRPIKDKFVYGGELLRAETGTGDTGMNSGHATYEALVVQYADDITWIIENLNDANSVSRLLAEDGSDPIYTRFGRLAGKNDLPAPLEAAIGRADSGGVYTFFINDLVRTSQAALQTRPDGPIGAVDEGDEIPIRLSDGAYAALKSMVGFLEDQVFKETRVMNRNRMLAAITKASLDILYSEDNDHLRRYAERQSKREAWDSDEIGAMESRLGDDVQRIQLAIDVLAHMSDQDIYEFTGLESI